MRRVKTPVLILTGSRDQQAVPEQVALQEAAFKEGGNKDVTARVLPDLNHLLVQDTDGFPGNYSKLPPPVMMRADVVGMIADWLAQRLRRCLARTKDIRKSQKQTSSTTTIFNTGLMARAISRC